MSLYDTIRRFKLLSGLEGEELSRYSELCSEAYDEIKSLVKVNTESLDSGKLLRLSYTAGALAFYKYCLYTSANEPKSFEAGEVRVTKNTDKAEAARKLFENELRGVSDLIKDKGFYFGRVRA